MAKYLESSAQGGMPDDLRSRVESVLGARIAEWTKPDTGLTAAQRYLVRLTDGSGAFVKAATDEQTSAWLRNEQLALSTAPYRLVPAILAWEDEPTEFPLLVTQDLSAAHWPASHRGVEWRPGDIALVFEALAELRAATVPDTLPRAASTESRGWAEIAAAPESFLALKLCSEAWLRAAIGRLSSAEALHDPTGDSWVHGDMRSDNICILDGRAVFVDWSGARRGHPQTDLAEWLPTLHLEGGPAPFSVLPDAAWASAMAARQASQAISERNAPEWLQSVFRRLAAINLEWAAESLDLPRPRWPGLRVT